MRLKDTVPATGLDPKDSVIYKGSVLAMGLGALCSRNFDFVVTSGEGVSHKSRGKMTVTYPPFCAGGPFPQATALPSPPSLFLSPSTHLSSVCDAPGEGGLGWRWGRGRWRGIEVRPSGTWGQTHLEQQQLRPAKAHKLLIAHELFETALGVNPGTTSRSTRRKSVRVCFLFVFLHFS